MTEHIDICEFPNRNEYHKGEKGFYWRRFKKPSIVCSDSHKEYKGEKYTWIKGEPTIEGLRQTLFEASRVSWEVDKPLEPINRINSIKINLPKGLNYRKESFCFSPYENEVLFSPYFTCIIGGRGTGKSSLLNILYESIKDDSNKLEVYQDGNRIKIADYTTVDYNYSNVEYLSQNEIEEFAKNKQKLTNTIFSRLNNLHKEDIEIKTKLLGTSLEQLKTHLDNQVSIYNKMRSLEKKKKELKETISIIESFQSEKYKELTQKLHELGTSHQLLSQSKSSFKSLRNDLIELITTYVTEDESNLYNKAIKQIIIAINREIQQRDENYFKEDDDKIQKLESEIEKLKEDLTKYLSERGLSQENLSDVARASDEKAKLESEIKVLQSEIDTLQSVIDKFDDGSIHPDCLEYQEFLKGLLEKINTEKLASIRSDYVKSINLSLVFDYEQCKDEIFASFNKYFDRIIKEYRQENNFDESKLRELLTFNLDDLSKASFLEAVEQFETQSKAKSFIKYLFNQNDEFYNFYSIIKKLELYNYEKYKLVKVTYDERELENTSFGQRCTGALVIILSLGNSPIIIDEPEAHLDSALISNYLVELIKESKTQRQIIFATHNANFVVNGDSELIHILKMDDNNKTIITSTTIENQDTRSELIALEGGVEAFKNREDKYGI